jgi:hypothetical protein
MTSLSTRSDRRRYALQGGAYALALQRIIGAPVRRVAAGALRADSAKRLVEVTADEALSYREPCEVASAPSEPPLTLSAL